MNKTIYELADEILEEVCIIIRENDTFNYQALALFLTRDDTQFENIFDNLKYSFDPKTKEHLKKIMMLIIITTSYQVSCFNIENKIDFDNYMFNLLYFDSLTKEQLIKNFYELPINENLEYFIDDYLIYIETNYLYQHACLQATIEQGNVKNLLHLNPFIIIEIIDFVQKDKLKSFEQCILDFYIIYFQAQYASDLYFDKNSSKDDSISSEDEELCEDETYEQATLEDKKLKFISMAINQLIIEKKLNANAMYAFLIGNLYETLKTEYDSEAYEDVIDFLEDESTTLEIAMEYLFEDPDFFSLAIDLFIEEFIAFELNDIIAKRAVLKEKSGLATLRKFDPFYDEEMNFFYSKLKIK